MPEAYLKMTSEEVSLALAGLEGWTFDQKVIKKTFKTTGYPVTMGLVAAIGAICQKKNHHPDYIIVKFKEIEVSFSTHSAGGVTGKDIEIAKEIEELHFP